MASLSELQAYNYLRARSPSGLRLLIHRHQIKTGRKFKYQFYFASGYHYAWYYGDETLQEAKELTGQVFQDEANN